MEPNVQQPISQEPVVHNFNQAPSSNFTLNNKILSIFFAAVVVGILSGFFLSRGGVGSANPIAGSGSNTSNIAKGTIIGSDDTKTFKDEATGVLKEGGIEGEGAFHLVRPGGESQNVYLTSSIVDLSSLLDRKVKVWGETQKARYAGWLMDVGRVEVLE